MKKKNIFVFPCGSEIGLEVHKALNYSTHFNIIGGSSVDDHGKIVYKNYVDGLPFVGDPDFVKKINDIIKEHSIDFIIPAHDNVILRLAESRAAGQLKCEIVTSPLDTCQIATSKLKTYERLKDIVPTPRIYKKISEIKDRDLPIFLKPEVGNGSRGTHLARSLGDIKYYAGQDPTLLMLEYLPGPEYTIDCFTNKTGKLLFSEGRRRARISNGISVNSVAVEDDRFEQIAKSINKNLNFRGGWFFQLKERENGELVLLEIAPRFAGTSGLARCKGVNLPLLSLFDAMGLDVGVFENKNNLVIDRALHNGYQHDIDYNHVYLDFDDLVVFEGKVNPLVVAFVYQCFNNGKSVHLITKHKEDLQQTLKKYQLDGVFKDTVLIKKEDEKYKYIKEKDAIFIDDSYAERKRIHDHLGIPTFDAHSIESLIEQF
jgi:hypothetical protein